MTLDIDRGLEHSLHVQVFLLVVGYPAARFVLRSAEPGCPQQDTRGVVRRNDRIFVIWRSQLSAAKIRVRAAGLRSHDRLGLRWRAIYVADEACNADLALRADGDIVPNGLVTANLVDPLQVAVAVIFHNERIVRVVRGSLDRTA